MTSELTEITEQAEAIPFRGWIFFDDDCCSCRVFALRFEDLFEKRGFHFEPLQRDWVWERLNLTREQALEEMRVFTTDGQVIGGADAVIFLARESWWTRPLAWIARLAFVRALLDRFYRWVAAHRTCSINPLARSVSAMIAIFWMARLAVQFFVFDARPFLTTAFRRIGYHGLTVLFSALVFIYGCVALNLRPL